ncbi:hypothetical protein PR202_ga31422 [Eleusine coracana subsp. coracana]|uniref:Uncharacterized protein n=1 Tax=Eleusine coracana subsp. coracana TaxID=191504 RepID=A0AAV5DRZ7_ELECO|nr:hypothetical protein PR202_ga31422 [Eleusine coracana subsp. coracana]
MQWWRGCRRRVPKEQRRGFNSMITLGAWLIWKHRNSCALEGTNPSMTRLIDGFMEECQLWCLAGAKGLRSLGFVQVEHPN